MGFVVRQMEIEDYDPVMALWRSSDAIILSGADSRERIQKLLERNTGLSYVAMVDEQIVGAVLCSHDGRMGYLTHLVVSEENKRQGIGRQLVSRCLYALMGLGLCSSVHWVKKINLGHIPEWYHEGGPLQIGHSHAATPESLCSLQVCFLAPQDDRAEDSLPQYHLGTIVSLWRKSQFTSSVIASRGPPLSY